MERLNTILEKEVDKFNDYTTKPFEYVSSKDLTTVVNNKTASTSTSLQVKAKYNTLGVVRMVVLVSIVALLAFLLIYNIFAMSSLQASIATTESIIASEQASVDLLKEQLLLLDSEAVIMEKATEAGYAPGAGTVVTGYVMPETTPITYEEQTNWFDAICKFISSIFGG